MQNKSAESCARDLTKRQQDMKNWLPEVGSRVRIDHQPSICHNREGQLLWLEEYGYCVLVDAYDVQRDGVLRSPIVEVQIGWLKPPAASS